MARSRRNPKPRDFDEAMAEHRARTAALARRRKRLAESARRHSRAGSLKKKQQLELAHDRVNAAQWRERARAEELAHKRVTNARRRRVVRNPDVGQLVPLLAIGGAAAAAYWFLWLPWHTAEVARQAAAAGVAKGMSLTDAANAAVAAGCVAGAAAFATPPAVSAGLCKGLAPIAVAGAKEAIKGAVVGAKLLGKETAKGAKAVASTAKKAAHAVTHGFGLWGLGDLGEGPRSSGVYRTTERRARGAGRTTQAAAAAFYLRHL